MSQKMETRAESTESSDIYNAKPSTSRDSLYTPEEDGADLVNAITISSEASVSQEDDFSQLKTKNTDRNKRARRRVLSDSSDGDSTSQSRLRKPSDSQYSSDDCEKNDSPKKINSNVEIVKPRTSSDSMYSSGEDKVDIVDPIITISSETQGSSREDDSSQLKTKNTERSRRARRCVSSDSSDNDKPEKSPRKPSDLQHSSKDRQKNNHLKRSISNDSHASEESDSSKPQKKNKKIEKVNQSPNKSLGREKKTPKKRKSSGDSLQEEDIDHDPPQTRNSKRRKKGRQPSPMPKDKATTSRKKKKSSKRSMSSDESSSKNSSDNSEEDTLSKLMFRNVIKKYSKKRPSSGSSSSDDTDNTEVYTISSEESSDDSESQSRTASPSEETSDESQVETKNKKERRKTRQLSSSSSEEASTSKENISKKVLSDSSSSDDEADSPQIKKKLSSHVESEPFEGGSISEEESKNSSISKDESDSSQIKKPGVSPKKYKNLRVVADTSDDDEKEKKLPVDSPKKIKNVHLLKHKYKELMPKVTFGSYKDVKDIIFDGKTDGALDLPEFSQLLWRVVKNNKIDPDKISLLIRAGVDINRNEAGEHSDSPENSVLHVVAEKAWRKKFEQIALLLMSYGANINKINDEGNSVLWSAVKGGSVIVVQELMRRRVEIGEEYNKVLRLAAESHSNSAQILPLLIEYNDADMETRDGRALYALRCLINADGDLTAMRVLLDYILPLDDIGDDGSTLLHRAVIDSKFEMVKLLLEYGANPRLKRKDSYLPLWFAARQPTSAIAGLLIKHGASVDDCNDLGQYPIHAACNSLSLENIRLLLHYGAEIDIPDNYYEWTPFTMVNHQKLTDVTKLIIQNLALLNLKDIKLHERDLERIRNVPDFRKYYAQCLSELHKVKTLIIYEDISVYCIFTYDAKKMSYLVNNSVFIDEYHKKKKEIQAAVPVYWPAIHKRMKIAWSRRDKLISIENSIREASYYILKTKVLTVDVCEKIARLACYDCLIDSEMREISSS